MNLVPSRLLAALLASILLFVVATACGGDSDSSSSTETTSVTSTTATTTELPPGAFTAAELAGFALTDVEGFARQEQALTTPTQVGIRYDEANEGGLVAEVILGPCNPTTCWDLVGVTEQQGADLKAKLPQRNLNDPNLVFEYGTIEIAPGHVAFFTYSRSFVQEGSTIATLDGYSVLYHDESNWISIIVTPANAPLPETVQELQRQMDQPRGEEAARAFFAALEANFEAQ